MQKKVYASYFLNKLFFSVICFIVLVILLLFKPLNTSKLFSNPDPAVSYEAAKEKIEEVNLFDTPEINPVCHSIVMDHGKKTEKVLLVFHGYTNCPKQFEKLGRMFYEIGFNVYIPRIPHHGLSDRLTNDLSNLTAEELVWFSDESVDIVQGLGDKVYVTGISAGGVMAAWVGQNRRVEKVIPIAPIFFYSYPKIIATPLTYLALVLPEKYRYWSDNEADRQKGPQYAYPRYSQKAIAQVFMMGQSLFNFAKTGPPQTKSAVFITIEGDKAINGELPYDLMNLWKKRRINVSSYQFTKVEAPIHDIIDPNQEQQRIDYIYPILIDLIES